MSYADQAAIYADYAFRDRLQAAVTKESRSKPGEMSDAILQFPPKGAELFLPWVTTEPGFDVADQATITDGQILSAIQAVWVDVESANYPAGE